MSLQATRPLTFATVWLIASAMLVGVTVQASSQPKRVIGNGAKTCGTWTQEHTAGTADYYYLGNWVVGYMSGVNVYTDGPDFLAQIDPNAVVKWIDNYCTTNPLELIASGAHALLQELQARADLNRRTSP